VARLFLRRQPRPNPASLLSGASDVMWDGGPTRWRGRMLQRANCLLHYLGFQVVTLPSPRARRLTGKFVRSVGSQVVAAPEVIDASV
jgi:hypothetical protein